MDYTTFTVTREGALARVTLDRSGVRNAFDETMIEELSRLFHLLAGDESVRVVVLSGAGPVFCAGADLNWMKRTADYTFEQNLEDARFFAGMVEKLYRLPQATVALVHGHCLGGGVGLASACDVVVASQDAVFALREVLLGIAPATISPYVLRKIGERWGRDYMLTGRKFDAARAHEIGLVNQVVDSPEDLEAAAERWIGRFMRVGPKALAATKALINATAWARIEDVQDDLADVIARLRASEEGREGFAAFFEKRRPKWDPSKQED
jgi:methylglutaconyl-CoA hydratase